MGAYLCSCKKPESVHQTFPLDLHLSSGLGLVTSNIVQQHLGLVRHLDLHGFPSALHPGGHIDGVTEETISGHLGADHPCSGSSGVDSNPDLESESGVLGAWVYNLPSFVPTVH